MTDSVINRFSTLATDPLRSFRFIVEFSDAAQNGESVFSSKITTSANAKASTTSLSTGFIGGFMSVSGLNITTQAIQYREGGYNTTVHQIPGMTTFTPITLQRGVLYGNDQAITWMRGLFAAASGDGIAAGHGQPPLRNGWHRCLPSRRISGHRPHQRLQAVSEQHSNQRPAVASEWFYKY